MNFRKSIASRRAYVCAAAAPSHPPDAQRPAKKILYDACLLRFRCTCRRALKNLRSACRRAVKNLSYTADVLSQILKPVDDLFKILTEAIPTAAFEMSKGAKIYEEARGAPRVARGRRTNKMNKRGSRHTCVQLAEGLVAAQQRTYCWLARVGRRTLLEEEEVEEKEDQARLFA